MASTQVAEAGVLSGTDDGGFEYKPICEVSLEGIVLRVNERVTWADLVDVVIYGQLRTVRTPRTKLKRVSISGITASAVAGGGGALALTDALGLVGGTGLFGTGLALFGVGAGGLVGNVIRDVRARRRADDLDYTERSLAVDEAIDLAEHTLAERLGGMNRAKANRIMRVAVAYAHGIPLHRLNRMPSDVHLDIIDENRILISIDNPVWPDGEEPNVIDAPMPWESPDVQADEDVLARLLRIHLDEADSHLRKDDPEWVVLRTERAVELLQRLSDNAELSRSDSAAARERAVGRMIELREQADILMRAVDQLVSAELDSGDRSTVAASNFLRQRYSASGQQ